MKNLLAYFHAGSPSGLLGTLIVVVVLAALAFYAIRTFIPDPFLNKLLCFVVVAAVAIFVVMSLVGCQTPPTPEQVQAYSAALHQGVLDYKEIKPVTHRR